MLVKAAAAAESPEIQFRIVGVDNSPSSSAESSFRELDDAFLQTQTRIWLGEVLQTRLDEQMNVSDLLADGKLLYQVSEVIWKMLLTTCMDMNDVKVLEWKSPASSKSTGRYMPYFNVASFLGICKILGLDGIDLFTPSDVVEKRDTRKVCMCIRSLSKKARSRSLNVPDFDIVTYTVAMPTDMVGCIRRSLELSQCSSSVSLSHDAEKDAKGGSWKWKRNSGSVLTGNSGYYSDGSVNSDGSLVVESHRTSPTYSNGMSPDSLMLRDYDSAQAEFKLNMGDYERDEIEGQYMPMPVAESVGSVSSQNDSDNELDSMQPLTWESSHFSCEVMQKDSNSIQCESFVMNHVPFQLNWADSTLAVDSNDGNALEDSDLLNIGTNRYCTHSFTSFDKFNEEDASETGSGISPKSTPASEIRYKACSYNKVEDAESISSSLARGMNMDLHHSCVEDDCTASRVHLLPLEPSCHQCKSSKEDYETPGTIRHNAAMHGLNFDIEKLQSDAKLEDDGPSEMFLQPDTANHAVKEDVVVQSDHSMPHSKDNLKAARLRAVEDQPCENFDTFLPNIFGQCIQVLDNVGEHNPTDTVAEHLDLAVESSELLNDWHHKVCTDHKNLHCEENIIEDGVRHSENNNNQGKPQHKPQRRLLKSVVSGTAVVGVLFLLLQIRKSRQEQVGKAGRQPGRASVAKEEGVTTGNVYPAEKLRFGF